MCVFKNHSYLVINLFCLFYHTYFIDLSCLPRRLRSFLQFQFILKTGVRHSALKD